jgi:hypothetical protein
MNLLKWDKEWGPKPLRTIIRWLIKGINDRTITAGLGIKIDETDGGGAQISVDPHIKPDDPTAIGGGGGGGGTPIDVYGAFNGAPAVFHLKQTSAPTPL